MGRLCAGAPDYFDAASAAIREMVRQTGAPEIGADGIIRRGTLIRHLVLPGCTGESISLLRWVRDALPPGIPVSLMSQYVPMGDLPVPVLRRRVTKREYGRVVDAMLALGLPGYTQEEASADEGFVPAFNEDGAFV